MEDGGGGDAGWKCDIPIMAVEIIEKKVKPESISTDANNNEKKSKCRSFSKAH